MAQMTLTPLEIEARRVTASELDQLFADTLEECIEVLQAQAGAPTKSWDEEAHPRHPAGTPVDDSTGEGGGRFAPKDGSAPGPAGDEPMPGGIYTADEFASLSVFEKFDPEIRKMIDQRAQAILGNIVKKRAGYEYNMALDGGMTEDRFAEFKLFSPDIAAGLFHVDGLQSNITAKLMDDPAGYAGKQSMLELHCVWTDENGEEAGQCTRRFVSEKIARGIWEERQAWNRQVGNTVKEYDNRDKDVDFAWMGFTEGKVKRGVAVELVHRQMQMLKAFGYKRAELYANATIGKYAWAKEGAEYRDASMARYASRKFVDWAKDKGIDLGDQWPDFQNVYEVATFDVPGITLKGSDIRNIDTMTGKPAVLPDMVMHLGKAFLLDSNIIDNEHHGKGHGSWDAYYHFDKLGKPELLYKAAPAQDDGEYVTLVIGNAEGQGSDHAFWANYLTEDERPTFSSPGDDLIAEMIGKSWDESKVERWPAGTPVDPATGEGGGRFAPKYGSAGESGEGSAFTLEDASNDTIYVGAGDSWNADYLPESVRMIARDYMNPQQIADIFDGGLSGGITLDGGIRWNGDDDDPGVKYSSTILDEWGNEAGYFTFTIQDKGNAGSSGDMDLQLYFNKLEIADRFQGHGLAHDILEKIALHAKKAGIGEIKLLADITIGRYAWAKYGFNWGEYDSPYGESNFHDWMADKGIFVEGDDYGTGDIYTARDLATFDIPGTTIKGMQITNEAVNPNSDLKVGKAYMLDENGLGEWFGFASPDDVLDAIQRMRGRAGAPTKSWDESAHPRHPAGTPVDDSTGEGGGRFAPKNGSAGESGEGSASIPYRPDQTQIDYADEFVSGEIRRALEEGETVDGVTRYINGLVAETIERGTLSVRADALDAMRILRQGRYKTQFETGDSNGKLNYNLRKEAEFRGMGVPEDIDKKMRPVYAYIAAPLDRSSQYGEVEFVLKDAVKDRTTITVGDSLAGFAGQQLYAIPMGDVGKTGPGWIGLEYARGVAALARNGETWGPSIRKLMDSAGYIEAQVHGGVSTSDVSKVRYHYNGSQIDQWRLIGMLPAKNLAQQARDAGVPMVAVDDATGQERDADEFIALLELLERRIATTKSWDESKVERWPAGTPVDDGTGAGGGRFAPKDDGLAIFHAAGVDVTSTPNMTVAERMRVVAGVKAGEERPITEEARRMLAIVEPQIADQPFEEIYVMSEDGTIIGHATGDYDSVTAQIDADDSSRKIVTHNHPDLSAPSLTDITTAIRRNIREMRVVAGENVYIVTMPDVEDRRVYGVLFESAFSRVMRQTVDHYGQLYRNGDLPLYEANEIVSHAVWRNFLDKYGEAFGISMERVPLANLPARPAYDKMIRSISVDNAARTTYIIDRGAGDDLAFTLPAQGDIAKSRYVALVTPMPPRDTDYNKAHNTAPDIGLVGHMLTGGVESFYSIKPSMSYRVTRTAPVTASRWAEIETEYKRAYRMYLGDAKRALGEKIQEFHRQEHVRHMAWTATAAAAPEIVYERAYREGKDPWLRAAQPTGKALAMLKAFRMINEMAGARAWDLNADDPPRWPAGTPVDPVTGAGGGRFAPKDGTAGDDDGMAELRRKMAVLQYMEIGQYLVEVVGKSEDDWTKEKIPTILDAFEAADAENLSDVARMMWDAGAGFRWPQSITGAISERELAKMFVERFGERGTYGDLVNFAQFTSNESQVIFPANELGLHEKLLAGKSFGEVAADIKEKAGVEYHHLTKLFRGHITGNVASFSDEDMETIYLADPLSPPAGIAGNEKAVERWDAATTRIASKSVNSATGAMVDASASGADTASMRLQQTVQERYEHPGSDSIAHIAGVVSESLGIDALDAKDRVRRFDVQWVEASNEKNGSAIQLEASERFGVEPSDWQKGKIDRAKGWRLMGLSDAKEKRAIVDAHYEHTQELLKKAGVKEVRLFRGVALSPEQSAKLKRGDVMQFDDNILSSWTPDLDEAFAFATDIAHMFAMRYGTKVNAGAIISTVVPAERIFATAFTGVGYAAAKEFVVIGTSEPAHAMVHAIYDDKPKYGGKKATKSWDESAHPRHPAGTPVDPATGEGGGRFAPKDGSGPAGDVVAEMTGETQSAEGSADNQGRDYSHYDPMVGDWVAGRVSSEEFAAWVNQAYAKSMEGRDLDDPLDFTPLSLIVPGEVLADLMVDLGIDSAEKLGKAVFHTSTREQGESPFPELWSAVLDWSFFERWMGQVPTSAADLAMLDGRAMGQMPFSVDTLAELITDPENLVNSSPYTIATDWINSKEIPDAQKNAILAKMYEGIGYHPNAERVEYADYDAFSTVSEDDQLDYRERQRRLAEVAERLQKVADEHPVAVMVDVVDIDNVLADGRLKTQHETGDSNGAYRPDYRLYLEEQVFGTPDDLPVDKRPVYGFVDYGNAQVEQYGDFKLVMKDGVKDRTTMTVGDTLNHYSDTDHAAAPIRNLTAHAGYIGGLTGLAEVMLDSDGRSFALDKGSIEYLEAHIHGGVSLGDVDYIELSFNAIEAYRRGDAVMRDRIDQFEAAGWKLDRIWLRPPGSATKSWDESAHPRHPAGTPVDDSTGEGGGRFAPKDSTAGESGEGSAESGRDPIALTLDMSEEEFLRAYLANGRGISPVMDWMKEKSEAGETFDSMPRWAIEDFVKTWDIVGLDDLEHIFEDEGIDPRYIPPAHYDRWITAISDQGGVDGGLYSYSVTAFVARNLMQHSEGDAMRAVKWENIFDAVADPASLVDSMERFSIPTEWPKEVYRATAIIGSPGNFVETFERVASASIDGTDPFALVDDAVEPAWSTKAIPYAPAKELVEKLDKDKRGALTNMIEGRGDSDQFNAYDVEDYTNRYIKDAVERYPIAVRVGMEDVDSIIASGRLMSQFETGDSNGNYSPTSRKAAESKGMGVPYAIDPQQRPIYGYLDTPGHTASSYGDVAFVMKDAIKERTTITAGDSLADFEMGEQYGLPIPMIGETGLGWVGSPDRMVDATRYDKPFDNAGSDFVWGHSYIEAQMHGGVSLGDVDRIIYYHAAYSLDLSKRAGEQVRRAGERFDAAGIPFTVSKDGNPEVSWREFADWADGLEERE